MLNAKVRIMKDKPVDLLPAELRRKTQKEVLSQSLRESASSAGKSLNPWRKNQGESSWVKVNQGESRHFETFFYSLRQKWPARSAAATPARF
jgi:hypothetical protein